jgi:hypothetical protein
MKQEKLRFHPTWIVSAVSLDLAVTLPSNAHTAVRVLSNFNRGSEDWKIAEDDAGNCNFFSSIYVIQV